MNTPTPSAAGAPSAGGYERWHTAVEIFLYPFHLVARVVARILVVFAALTGLAVAAALPLFAAVALGWDLGGFIGVPEEWVEWVGWADVGSLRESGKQILGDYSLVALLGTLGILGTLITRAWSAIQESFRAICAKFRDLRGGWLPRLNARLSWDVTWNCYIRKIGGTALGVFKGAGMLLAAVALMALLVVFGSLSVEKDAEWQKRVEEGQKEIIGRLDDPSRLGHTRSSPVIVVTAIGTTTEAVVVRPSTLATSTVFAIGHVGQASLATGEGICLDDNVSLPWLTEFRAALVECGRASPGCRPKVVVKAFASAAPFKDQAEGPSQDALNCEAANRRAEEIVNFLRDGEYACRGHKHDRGPYGDTELCVRPGRREFAASDARPFDILYEPWPSHEAMQQAKPADDMGDERRRKVEFLNRSVHLILSDYGCGRAQCAAAASARED